MRLMRRCAPSRAPQPPPPPPRDSLPPRPQRRQTGQRPAPRHRHRQPLPPRLPPSPPEPRPLQHRRSRARRRHLRPLPRCGLAPRPTPPPALRPRRHPHLSSLCLPPALPSTVATTGTPLTSTRSPVLIPILLGSLTLTPCTSLCMVQRRIRHAASTRQGNRVSLGISPAQCATR